MISGTLSCAVLLCSVYPRSAARGLTIREVGRNLLPPRTRPSSTARIIIRQVRSISSFFLFFFLFLFNSSLHLLEDRHLTSNILKLSKYKKNVLTVYTRDRINSPLPEELPNPRSRLQGKGQSEEWRPSSRIRRLLCPAALPPPVSQQMELVGQSLVKIRILKTHIGFVAMRFTVT